MVQIIDRKPSFGEQFGRAVGTGAGQGLQSGLENQRKMKELALENEAIFKETGINLAGITDPDQRKSRFQEEIQKRRDEQLHTYEKELNEEKKLEDLEKTKKTVDLLIERGVDSKDAELYAELTTGGQTQFAKDILEGRKRGKNTFGGKVNKPFKKIEDIQDLSAEAQKEEKPEFELEQELDNIISEQDEDLLPSEKVKRGTERFNTGLKIYQEASSKLRGATRDKERLDILENLSDSDKLPKDFGRLNVDDEGNLRFPFASSPEAQRYVKTLNEFSVNAKESYGSRVTNFDLAQFFKRFPNLLNSKEGRKQIAKQMKIVNEINSVYYKNLKNVYDKAGGVRKIDADVAESLADKITEPQIQNLVKKFDEIGQFTSKPQAKEFSGRKIRDKETGEVYQSNGTEWVKAE